jgi:hypothetical protein
MTHIDINAVNIRAAAHRGDLRLIERQGRFGSYVSIQDRYGTIETAEDMGEANRRVQGVLA